MADSVSRPKFSRRPASFASETTSEIEPNTRFTPAFASPQARTPSQPNTLPWPEDIRFGIALVLVLLCLNLMLIVVFPSLPERRVSNERTESIAATGRMPQPVSAHGGAGDASVTFYAQPAQKKAPHDLPYEDSVSSGLSVSPQQFPVPVAQPLDAAQSMQMNLSGPSADSQ